jgi:serine/threonine protein kinase/Flp pilus assembly protein TadD
MARESAFGAEPEQLRELLSFGMEDSGEKEAGLTASLGAVLERPGGQIGRYKLLSVLGEGGMGIVYLAEQEHPIRRQVALKVIKPGMDSKRVIARFEAERQALALLDHPNIAHVFDAETTDAGRPYFVMEYVEGLPITEHCDRHKLTIEDRLNLFLQVCQAVHHAHQKGIIHRDIKPSNILVSTEGDRAIPKIIDFGVAKAISQPLTERTLFTEQGQLFGTPEYMSPEQADMATEDIDTRSDIYSLGVLLYVLLTGVLPFDSASFREGGIEHMRQIIRETDLKTASTRLTKLGDEGKAIAQNRGTQVHTLARHLRQELEWIPLKAMRKEPAERYRSASELADDIQNYLCGAPLIAGPPSTVYKLKKFLRRNRALATGIAAVVVVLIAGVVFSTIFAIRAEQKARTAQAISDFFTKDVIASVDPLTGEQPEASLASIMDVASRSLGGKFKDEPLIEASIRYTIGRTYWHLGKHDAAEANLKRAVELRRKRVGTDDRYTLDYMQELASAYFYHSRFDEAEALLIEVINSGRGVLNELDPVLLRATSQLGWLYIFKGRSKEAANVLGEALEAVQRKRGAADIGAAGYMEGLAVAYRSLGRVEEAEELSRKALDIYRRVRGEESDGTLNLILTLGDTCRRLGRYDEAEELYVKALKARRRLLGEEHFKTLTVMRHLGSLYVESERYDEAEQLLVRALETNRRLYGKDDLVTLETINDLGVLRRKQKRYEEAEELLTEALNERQVKFGPDHPGTLETINDLGVLRRQQKRYDEAESLLRQALEGRQRKLGDDHPACFESMHELAVLYKVQGKYDDAERLLLEAVEDRRLKLGDEHPHTLESWKKLIELYEASCKPEKAEEWRATLPDEEGKEKQ